MKDENTFIKYDLNEELDKFFTNTSSKKLDNPNFVILMGGVGSGKTTIRNEKYAKDYVLIDAAEVFKNLGGDECYKFGEDFLEPMEIIGAQVISRAIDEKQNIVTEIIGSVVEEVEPLIKALKAIGYKVTLEHVHCDPAESYKRHLKAVDSDPHYISSYFTQSFHAKWILDAVKDRIK